MNNVVSWYREPWAWFNLILLSIAIVSCLIMTALAVSHTPAELDEHWYREGVLAKQQKQQEALIKSIDLRGEMTFSQDNKVTLYLSRDQMKLPAEDQKLIDRESLQLYIAHSSRPERDQKIELKRVSENHYSGMLMSEVKGKYSLMLSQKEQLWYLTSEGYFPLSSPLHFRAS